ncbi:MAG: hypothetical protein ACRDZP_07460, partial [Acidimicrobiales bacterium]
HKCSAATSPGPNLILEANGTPPVAPASYTCSASTTDMTFNNASSFEPNIAVLIYSLGQVSYANAPSMTGQIQACGGMTGTNAFTLAFNPSAGQEIFGTPGGGITIAPEDKYVVSG